MAALDVSANGADTEGTGWRNASPCSFLLPASAHPQCRQVPGKQHSRPLFPGEWRSCTRAPILITEAIRRLLDGEGKPALRPFRRGPAERLELHRRAERTGVLASDETGFGRGRGSMPPPCMMLPILALPGRQRPRRPQAVQFDVEPRRRRHRLPGRHRLGHRRMVEHRLADLRDAAQGRRPQPLYLRSRPRL